VPLSDFAVEWLPCGCQKLHPTVFWQIETENKGEKTEKKYMFLVSARTLTQWVGSLLGAPWRNKKNTFCSGRCAVVGFCCKMAPLRLPKVASNRFLTIGDQNKREKTEKKYMFLIPARTLTLWVGSMLSAPGPKEQNTFRSDRCAVLGFGW
jgi:hypothetical protein